MAEVSSLESLQDLYTDLLALSESRLSSIERLGAELDAHIKDFRNLLDKKPRNEQSRLSLAEGKLDIAGDQYMINDDFQQGVLQLSSELNLDELDAAQIFLEVQDESDSSGRSGLTNSIVRFHQRRKTVLDCLQLLLQLSTDEELNEALRGDFQSLVAQIIQPDHGAARYAQRCLSSMDDIKKSLQLVVDGLNRLPLMGPAQQAEAMEIVEYQRVSLVKQHESLGIIMVYLVKENLAVGVDFERVQNTLRKADKYDSLLLHYFPAVSAFFSRLGGAGGGRELADARALNDKIFERIDEKNAWALPYVHAAFRALWLAEYSSWYTEHSDGSIPNNQLEDEAIQRSKQFSDALKDGAFDFILSISADVKAAEWHDPARHGLRQWLQRKAPIISADSIPFSQVFQELQMEQLEGFIEAFITNLPDVLRKLRVDEDEQRQLSKEHEHDLDLEKFIVIISYAFEGRPKAAYDGFWDVPDGALLGFVHWASKRASTPLVSAFCEMLQAIAENEDCATAAHQFLLDDGTQSSGKMKRTHSLTWNQIFKELTFFSSKIRDRPALPQPQTFRNGKPNIDLAETEPESAMMLEWFEEPNAFVQLLHALVMPYHDETGLHDELPFPETLGISTRQPGIDPYIDFALGYVFAERVSELNDIAHVRLLHLSCLDLIATCLDTFNEDLVIFASQSNISVDVAIQASSLQNYVLLHPFSRVMEWMFNAKVMAAVFASVHHDAADVASAAPDSPLILCLLRGIRVITSIIDLQPTYLDIIRPLIKTLPNYRRAPVPNAAFTSFEDGILNNLSIISDLGRYCGTGHVEVVIASLKLLEKLSASPKLSYPPSAGLGRGSDRNKALAALEDDAVTISKILLQEMEADFDVNQGPQSSAYITKVHILDFLIACLRAGSGQPTIAHLLLGFQCGLAGVSVDANGSFSRGVSLFHTILGLVLQLPTGDDTGVALWLVSLKLKAMHVLRELWSSPMSSKLVMSEMQANDAFFIMFVKEEVIQPEIFWDGLAVSDPTFSLNTSATCLAEYLSRRALVLQYLSAELHQIVRNHSPLRKQRMLETLLGSTTLDDGQKIDHATIFDLFDFMGSEFHCNLSVPNVPWFSEIDLRACLDDAENPASSSFDLSKIEEILVLRRAELTKTNRLEKSQDVALVNSQAQQLLEFYTQDNQITNLGIARLAVLKAWVQLTLVMIACGEFDGPTKISFVLRALQVIMPRLEGNTVVVDEDLQLARLAKALIFNLDFTSEAFQKGGTGALVSDRLFHLFQVSLRAISTLGSKVSLKEHYYSICHRYLSGMADLTGISGLPRRHSVQTIKSAGDRFIDCVCDDAHGGEGAYRITALLVLCALVKLGKQENSKYIIESLSRLNFISILVESIQSMSAELQVTAVEDVDMYLSYCHARLALLLSLSQSRLGASAVLSAGLFNSVRASGLFAIDPDLGVDIDGPGAVNKHYNLLAAVVRILCTNILSRGSQNQQTIELGRRFLSENRLSILAALKKYAGLGAGAGASDQGIDDLAETYMLLISVADFIDFEDNTIQKQQTRKKVFVTFT
ncbi:hypothetical protein JHW43_007958 [Diplocarpon mali]|nr:hypothetical protein JHW43_007958 [Diplocarpon mali]